MANESVVINGVTIGRTTSLNNTTTLFNSQTDYIFIGRIDGNGVIQEGFRVKLTDLAEDYAGELLIDVDKVISDGKTELQELTESEKEELQEYVNQTLKGQLDSYTSQKKGEVDNYVATVVLPAFDTHADGKIAEATDAANSAVSAKNQAEAAKDDAETAKGNVETLKAQIETLISQLGNTAQTKTVFPVMIEGEQFGLSVSVDGGDVIYTISEIEPEEETA